MKEIPLTRGYVALVDDDDYARVVMHKWQAVVSRWSVRPYSDIGGKRIAMHRFILGDPPRLEVDHINHDNLDNRRENLRLCSHRQNTRNTSRHCDCTSKYKGVSWVKERQKWCAHIGVNYRAIYLGQFDSEDMAAQAYNDAAKLYFGDFASLNVIP